MLSYSNSPKFHACKSTCFTVQDVYIMTETTYAAIKLVIFNAALPLLPPQWYQYSNNIMKAETKRVKNAIGVLQNGRYDTNICLTEQRQKWHFSTPNRACLVYQTPPLFPYLDANYVTRSTTNAIRQITLVVDNHRLIFYLCVRPSPF